VAFDSNDLTDEQARCLRALLESRPKRKDQKQFWMPEHVRIALAAKGLVWWSRGIVEITLDGIRQIARLPLPED